MKYTDLRDFVRQLTTLGELKKITKPIATRLEMTALSDRALRQGGPALCPEQPVNEGGVAYNFPVLADVFGTPRRVALAMGADDLAGLRDVGRLLASLKEPEPPRGVKDAGRLLGMAKALWDMKPATVRSAPCREMVI